MDPATLNNHPQQLHNHLKNKKINNQNNIFISKFYLQKKRLLAWLEGRYKPRCFNEDQFDPERVYPPRKIPVEKRKGVSKKSVLCQTLGKNQSSQHSKIIKKVWLFSMKILRDHNNILSKDVIKEKRLRVTDRFLNS